jgi:hypothetical protein
MFFLVQSSVNPPFLLTPIVKSRSVGSISKDRSIPQLIVTDSLTHLKSSVFAAWVWGTVWLCDCVYYHIVCKLFAGSMMTNKIDVFQLNFIFVICKSNLFMFFLLKSWEITTFTATVGFQSLGLGLVLSVPHGTMEPAVGLQSWVHDLILNSYFSRIHSMAPEM